MNATKRLIRFLKESGVSVSYDPATAAELEIDNYRDAQNCDILFVIGGDGTILQAVHRYVRCGVKFVGINYGHLGFMSEIGLDEVPAFVKQAREGHCYVDDRMLLEARIEDRKQNLLALNDFVITEHERLRTVRLGLLINDVPAGEYDGDGLIVSTATGSTAYSLSAGGPIVAPNVSCVLVTPLCPHSLMARSIVAGPDDSISIVARSESLLLTPDGRSGEALANGECVHIRKSSLKAQFLRSSPDFFFPTLKTKLAQW